jgi:phosphatidylinositol glycan class V
LSILSLPARCIISAVFISNICHFISVIILYDLSCHIFEDTYFAFLSAAFMVLVPMQAVMSSAYSESLFTCLTLLGISSFYRKERLSAALAWFLAGATRSNGVFMPGFFIYEYIHAVRHMPKRKALLRLIRLLILCLISWTGFFGVLLFGQRLYCIGDSPRPWCKSSFPNIYAFVQDHYWNVGFLRYYSTHQIPNFILSSPTILFSIFGIYEYVKTDWIWTATLGLSHRSLTIKKRPYHSRALLPHIYLWAFMLTYAVLIVHVQIITRLFIFMPVVCWCHAHLYYMAGVKTRGSISQRQLHLLLLGSFSAITSVLFFSFYPPA